MDCPHPPPPVPPPPPITCSYVDFHVRCSSRKCQSVTVPCALHISCSLIEKKKVVHSANKNVLPDVRCGDLHAVSSTRRRTLAQDVGVAQGTFARSDAPALHGLGPARFCTIQRTTARQSRSLHDVGNPRCFIHFNSIKF